MADICLVIVELVTAVLELASAVIDVVSKRRPGSHKGLKREKSDKWLPDFIHTMKVQPSEVDLAPLQEGSIRCGKGGFKVAMARCSSSHSW